MVIKSRLKELAARHEIKSLQRLAEEIDVSQTTLYNFANNKSGSIDLEVLEKLCKRLGCTPGDLLDYRPGEPGNGKAEPAKGVRGRAGK